MFRQTLPALVLGAVFAAALPVNAQCVQNDFMPANRMNLTAAQQKEMQNIRQKYATDEARQAMQTSRPFSQEMQDILSAKTFDEDKARDLLARRAQVQNEMQLRMMRQQHEMHQVLTPQQREIWQQNRQQNFARQGQGQGRRGMRGQNAGQTNTQPCMMWQ